MSAGPGRNRLIAALRCCAAMGILALAAACASGVPLPTLGRGDSPAEPVGTAWPNTLMAAHRAIGEGRYDRADRALVDFVTAYPGTAEAVEAEYWRAVVALDPANSAGSARDATTLLSRYLDSRLPLTHRAEATVLHRLAASLAETQRSGSAARTGVQSDASDAEVQRLKRELEETKAELERIRKRLAPPAAGTPPPATPPPSR